MAVKPNSGTELYEEVIFTSSKERGKFLFWLLVVFPGNQFLNFYAVLIDYFLLWLYSKWDEPPIKDTQPDHATDTFLITVTVPNTSKEIRVPMFNLQD